MDIANALQIVLDLAKVARAEKSTLATDERMKEAIDIVEDMAVNQFGDDFEHSPKIKVSDDKIGAIHNEIYKAIVNVLWIHNAAVQNEEIEKVNSSAGVITATFFEVSSTQV